MEVVNKGSDDTRRSGQVAKLAFIPTKPTLHGKLYTAKVEILSTPPVITVPDDVKIKYLPPRWMSGLCGHGLGRVHDF